ncbi:MAG: rhodanese-like domain-containing protein [Saccharofermentanales bacterium]
MKNKFMMILTTVILLSVLSGCAAKNTEDSSVSKVFKKISAQDAKAMMEQNKDAIILDVRTLEEFNEGHIKNAVLIPDNEIIAKAESVLTDKNALILVYCRSGRRSALAANDLVTLGYSNVYDFGGIIDWGYEIVK